MVIVLMGVAGSGKTTIGKLLAERLGWPFRDADDFHSPQNLDKMRRGIALDDGDRRPWLEAIRASIIKSLSSNENAIYACSALKRGYRQILSPDPNRVKFVYLKGSSTLIGDRLAKRTGHFFDPALLPAQFKDLQEPTDALGVDISSSPASIADRIVASLGLSELIDQRLLGTAQQRQKNP